MTTQQTLPNLKSKWPTSPVVILFRGPLGSGKTTACDYLVTKYNKVKRIAFADALKEEIYDIFFLTPERALSIDKFKEFMKFGDVMIDVPSPPVRFGEQRTSAFCKLIPAEEKIAWFNANKVALRKLIQYWGTEVNRARYSDVWIDKMIAKVREALAEGYTVVVDDCRIVNDLTTPQFESQKIGDYQGNELRAMLEEFNAAHIYIDPQANFQEVRDGTSDKGIKGHLTESGNNPDDPSIDYLIRNSFPIESLYAEVDNAVAALF